MNNTKNSLPPERQTVSGGAKRGGMGCSIVLALLLVALVAAAGFSTPRLLRFFDTRTEVAPLSADASAQVQKLGDERSKEQEQLNQYGWVDKSAGVARIPIARAIALIAAQGLPVGIPPTPTPAPAEAISATAEVSATAPVVDLEHVDFVRDVLPIFEAHCTKCHGGDNPEEGLELTSRKKVLAGSLNGGVVKPGDPDNSYLVEMITKNKMPKKGPPLSQTEKDIIIAWIKAGALDSPTSSEAPASTNALSATTALSGTAEVSTTVPLSTSTALSESAAVSTTAVASPTLDLSKVDLNDIHFSTDVLPIFEAHCFKCHGDIENPEEGLQLTSRKKIMAGSLNGSVVKPGDPDNSYLVKMIVEKKMPKRGAPLSQLEIDIIIAWIKAGALDDSPSDASASSTVTKTTTVSNTDQVTSTVAAVKPTATVSATLAANTSATVTTTATMSATKSVSATPTKAAATNTSTPAFTATQAVTKSITPAATATLTATTSITKNETPTATATPAVTATEAVTESVTVTATTAATDTTAAAPISETTTISSTFDPTKVDLNDVSFKSDVLPIFEQHCFKCHGDIENPEEGLQLTSRKKVMAGSLNGGVVSPGDPDKSYLVEMITKNKMPKKGPPLSQIEKDIIIAWIKQGALDN